MTKTVVLAESLDPSTWEQHEVEDVREFLIGRFSEFPPTGRIFHQQVARIADVTPLDEASIARLGQLPGPFYVVVFPGETSTIIMIVAAAVSLVVASWAGMPPRPKTVGQGSANNDLSERKNEARPLERIPDIFGTVRSVPDLLAVPYTVFETVDRHDGSQLNAHREVEYAFMCIGRGEYEIEHVRDVAGEEQTTLWDVRDGATLLQTIEGAGAEIYGPNTSPGSGTPQLVVGPTDQSGRAIHEPVFATVRCEAVNGQSLDPPNRTLKIWEERNLLLLAPNKVRLRDLCGLGFTGLFGAGDLITIRATVYMAQYSNIGHWYELVMVVVGSSTTIPQWQLADPQPPGAPPDPTQGQSYTDPSGHSFTWVLSSPGSWVVVGGGSYAGNPNPPLPSDPYDGQRVFITETFGSAVIPLWVEWRANPGSTLNLDGTYLVLAGQNALLELDNPAAVNPNWNSLPMFETESIYTRGQIDANCSRWVGAQPFQIGAPAGFFLDAQDADWIYANFVAPSGLYFDDGKDWSDITIHVKLEVTPVYADGVRPRGDAETFPHSNEAAVGVVGSWKNRNQRALTYKFKPALKGPWLVRACRIDEKDWDGFKGMDEVRWRDLYAMREVTSAERAAFGNVTTIHTVTHGTTGALSVKDRKLNAVVTRKVKRRGVGTLDADGFSTTLEKTSNAADIFVAICRDPRIGNRALSELHLDSIYSAVQRVIAHFGSGRAGEFCYTFDKSNLSFEETAAMIAEAVFCTAYRRGAELRLLFEEPTSDSVLLFNHRNKVPGSESRFVSFGRSEDNDGIEYTWVDPTDEGKMTMYWGRNGYANADLTNPLKVESVGVRNALQAYFHAARHWNRLLYQSVSVEFEATQEAALLVPTNRILVADNTRPDTQDGEVVAQNVLELTLSRTVSFVQGQAYTIFLQHADGTVESLSPVIAGSASDRVVLPRAPRTALALEPGYYARTGFVIVRDDDPREQAFLMVEREPQGFTSIVRAVNYDARYYQNDQDYRNGIVDENGNPIALPPAQPGVFVVISSAGSYPATSADGVTWVEHPIMPGQAEYTAFGNGSFVALGYPDVVFTSPTGEVWTERQLPVGALWQAIAFGNGVHVAVGRDLVDGEVARVVVSSDGGATWSASTMPTPLPDPGYPYNVVWTLAFADGVFLAVAEGFSTGAVSTNGVDWTQITMPALGDWWWVVGGNGLFIVICSWREPSYVAAFAVTDDNGQTWTVTEHVYGNDIQDAVYNAASHVFTVMVGAQSTALTTLDGITFTTRTLPLSGGFSLACGGGRLVATAYDYANNSTALVSTDDAVTWTIHTISSTVRHWPWVCWGNP